MSADQASFNVGAGHGVFIENSPILVSADQASFNVGAYLGFLEEQEEAVSADQASFNVGAPPKGHISFSASCVSRSG